MLGRFYVWPERGPWGGCECQVICEVQSMPGAPDGTMCTLGQIVLAVLLVLHCACDDVWGRVL